MFRMGEAQAPVSQSRWRPRVWLYRYLPAEIVGTAAALAAALIATGEGVASAVVAATWAESLGFYGSSPGGSCDALAAHAGRRGALVLALRGVVAEFGVAEAADTIFVRPALMYAFVDPLGGVLPE